MNLTQLANVRQLKAVQTKIVADYLMNDVFFNVRQFNPFGTSNGSTMSLTVNKYADEEANTELRDFGDNYTADASVATPETYYLQAVGKGFYDDKGLSRGLTEAGRSKWLDTQIRQAVNATKKKVAKVFIDGGTTTLGGAIVGLKGITTTKSLTFDEVFDGTVAPSVAQAQAFLVFFNKAKASVPHCNSIECSPAMGALLESYGAMLNMYTTEVIVGAALDGIASTSITLKKFGGIPIVTYDNVTFSRDDVGDIFEEFYLVYNSEEDGISLALPDMDDEIVSISLPAVGGKAVEEGMVEILTQVIDMTKHSVVRVTGYQTTAA